MNKKYMSILSVFIILVLSILLVDALVMIPDRPIFGRNPLLATGSWFNVNFSANMINISGSGFVLHANVNGSGRAGVVDINVTNVTFWYSKDNTTWTKIGSGSNDTSTDTDYNVTWNTTAIFGGEANNITILVLVGNSTVWNLSGKSSFRSTELNATYDNSLQWNSSVSINATEQLANNNITNVLIDNLAPRIVDINVSVNLSNGSIITLKNDSLGQGVGNWLPNGTSNGSTFGLRIHTIQIAVQIADLHASSVNIAFNTTGGPVNSSAVNISTERTINFTGTAGNPSRLDNTSNSTVIGSNVVPMAVLNSSLISSEGDGNLTRPKTSTSFFPKNPSTWVTFITVGNITANTSLNNITFAVVINDTVLHYTVDSRGTAIGYTFGIDDFLPTPTLSLSKTSIEAQGSIDITCKATDSESGVNGTSTRIFLQKPAETSLTEIASGVETKTLSGADTGEAGTYYTSCEVADNAGWSASTSTLSFLVTYGTAGPTAGAGGGGGGASVSGGGGSTTVEEEEVLYVTTTPASVTSPLGGFVKFTLDKTNVHTLTVDSLTETAAIIVLTPIGTRETLDLGASKDIDITNDGITDITTTLSSIVDGTAQLTLKVVEAAAPAEEVTKEVTEEKPIKRGLGWLWILIIIVIIAIIVALVVRKKRR